MRGSSRTAGAAGPAQFVFTVPTNAAVPSERSAALLEPSIRGSAPMKCSFCATCPRPGTPAGDIGRDLPVELGVHDVAEPQLQTAQDLVLQRGPHLHVTGRRDHDMDAVTEPARGDVGDDLLQILVLGPETAPAVHDQEDIAPGLAGQFAQGTPAPVGGDGIDGVGAEELLAPVQHTRDLGDRTPHPLRVKP